MVLSLPSSAPITTEPTDNCYFRKVILLNNDFYVESELACEKINFNRKEKKITIYLWCLFFFNHINETILIIFFSHDLFFFKIL
jgi:hypothetical protein